MQVACGMLFPVKSQSSSRVSNGYAGNPYLSGEIESTRLDFQALGLTPLKLEARGTWDPADHFWGEEGEPIENWAKPVIPWGSRPEFEMEQVLPGADLEDPFLRSPHRIQRS